MQNRSRRLAAIVAADVVGFSRLVGQDEEATLAAMRGHRVELINGLIAHHGGRIANTAGDSLLMEFPSVVEAVRCAIAIQQGLGERNSAVTPERRVEYRIGINVGDVVAEGDDLLGDGVNIAARLETCCQPNGIALSDDAYRQVRDRLDVEFRDAGEVQAKNIARPIHVWLWPLEGGTAATPQSRYRQQTDKRSIALLPFINMSDDKDQGFLADGIVEDIITGLSMNRHLSVAARTSTFALKGRLIDIREIAKDLGVDYVVEGSIRRLGNRIRITVQLIDAGSGGHLWAEKYDRAAEEFFDVQDEVIANITGALGAQLTSAEFERVKRIVPGNMTSWEAVQRALALYSADAVNPATLPGIVADLRATVQREPDYAYGHSVLAWTLSGLVINGYSADFKGDLADSASHLRIGIKLGGDDPLNLFYCGAALIHLGQQKQAIDLLERSLQRNPNSADTLLYLGVAYGYAGQFAKAYDVFDRAEAMAPTGGFAAAHSFFRAKVKFLEGDFEAAAKMGERFILSQPDFGAAHIFYGLGLALSGRQEEAEASIRHAVRSDPNLNFKTLMPYVSAHPDPEEAKRRRGILRELWEKATANP